VRNIRKKKKTGKEFISESQEGSIQKKKGGKKSRKKKKVETKGGVSFHPLQKKTGREIPLKQRRGKRGTAEKVTLCEEKTPENSVPKEKTIKKGATGERPASPPQRGV